MKEFCKILDAVYVVCLSVLVLSCIAMLLVQISCLFIMNGPVSARIESFIIPKAGVFAAVMIVAVVILSYLRSDSQ